MDLGIPAAVLVLACLLLPVVWRIRQARRREQARDALRASRLGEATGLEWIPVQASRPAWYRRLHARHEAGGWFGVDAEAGALRLLVQSRDGEIIDRAWPLAQAQVKPGSLRSSLMAGFLIGSEPLLLAADTGANEMRNWRATVALLRRLAPTARLPAIYAFPVENNRWSLGCAVLFFALILYGFVETVAMPYVALARPPAVEYAQLLLPLLALVAVPLLRRGGVPKSTARTLATMLGIALLNAAPKLFQRIDALTATDAFAEHAYRLGGDGRFAPLAAELPPLQLRGAVRNALRGLPPGTEQRFLLRRGGLGIWQFDDAPLRERLRAEAAAR